MKAYIIHLPSLSSKNHITTQFSEKFKNGNPNIDLHMFNGVMPQEADAKGITLDEEAVKQISPIEGYCSTFDNSEELRFMRKSGVKGCFLSHYNLWKECVELNEPIMILEDDVFYLRPYIPVDFNELLIVSTKLFQRYYDNMKGDKKPKALPLHESHIPGTSGYVIKPSAAKKLIEKWGSGKYMPTDLLINTKDIDIQIHSCLIGYSIENASYTSENWVETDKPKKDLLT